LGAAIRGHRESGGKATNRQRLGIRKKSSLAAGGTRFEDFSIKKITQFKPILLKIYAFKMWHKK